MRGLVPLSAEIVGRRDQAAAEMVLPEAIHDDAGEQMSGALVGVGDPVGQRGAAVTRPGSRWRLDLPVLLAVGGVLQHGEEALGGFAFLLVHVAALAEI